MGGTESRYELHVICVKQSSEVILDLSLLQKQSIITTHKKSGLYMIKIIWVSEIFLGFICNCLSYFITAKITFTCILHPQCTNMIFIIYTSRHSLHVMDISLSPNFRGAVTRQCVCTKSRAERVSLAQLSLIRSKVVTLMPQYGLQWLEKICNTSDIFWFRNSVICHNSDPVSHLLTLSFFFSRPSHRLWSSYGDQQLQRLWWLSA